jgi:hypothetical protein
MLFASVAVAQEKVAPSVPPTIKELGQRPPPPRKELSAEAKKLRAEIIAKYDENKDGVLSIDEREKVSPEDRKKMKEAGLGRPPRKEGKPPIPPPHKPLN